MHRGFAFCFLIASLGTIALIATGVATQKWTVARLPRSGNESDSDCSAIRTIGLFKITDERKGCISDSPGTFDVYDKTVIDFNAGLKNSLIVLLTGLEFFSLIT